MTNSLWSEILSPYTVYYTYGLPMTQFRGSLQLLVHVDCTSKLIPRSSFVFVLGSLHGD